MGTDQPVQQLFENPMGTAGMEFIEFTTPDPVAMDKVFRQMGFTAIAKHRTKNVTLYRQGGINFLLNVEPATLAANFAREHGPSVSAMCWRVKDVRIAYDKLRAKGAWMVESGAGPMELNIPAIKGIGDSLIYLVDRWEGKDGAKPGDMGNISIYDVDFEPIPGVDPHPVGYGFKLIDHLTHNVYRGRMAGWEEFYARLFNFREIRYFDLEGKKTGVKSKALTSPCGLIRIPINEEGNDTAGQIQEYLDLYKGEGIQHIALSCDDLRSGVDKLKAAGIEMLDTPDTYYEMLDERIPGHGEDIPSLQARRILLDGQPGSLLLQIFSENQFGPVFFEFIQRRGNEGFGEGNFLALFESIELDQIRRGVLHVDA